ncbi:MAG: SDR family NAD(P)-dependent oxidoreductase, partial [Pseudomonadales bacterium]|nr:SDR family NAD(P)-dependent oxidoreductase [Pseudomonadales bacterium]
MKNSNIAVVTGSTSDIGSELCRILLKRGYRLVNIDRDNKRALQVKERLLNEFPNGNIHNFTADFAQSKQIRAVAEEISKHCDHIDLLFHNAGVLTANKILSRDNIEMHFAINCIAPYLLTKHLMPLLNQADDAKVIISGSGASSMAMNIKVDQLVNPETFKGMTGSYAQSKASVKVLFSYLQTKSQHIKYSVVDLSPTKTKMTRSEAMPTIFKWASFLFTSPEKSAQKLYASIQQPNAIKIKKSQ